MRKPPFVLVSKLLVASVFLVLIFFCYLLLVQGEQATVTAGQLLVNPGFELAIDNRPQGWANFGGNLYVTSAFARTGNYAAALESSTASTKWLYQIVSVRAGSEYALSGYGLKNDGNVASVMLRILWFASADGTGASISASDSPALSANSPGFVSLSTSRTVAPPGANSAAIRVVLFPVSEAQGRIYVDDLSLTEGFESPTATASASRTPTSYATSTPSPSPSASLVGSIRFQGRGAPPDARWIVPVTVTMHSPESLGSTAHFGSVTDPLGQFTATGIVPGIYDIRTRKAHSLTNKRANVYLAPGASSVSLGTLLEGDANGDGAINGLDYSLLAAAYFRVEGEVGFDARADFNDDGRIASPDYAVLAANYLKRNDIAVEGW